MKTQTKKINLKLKFLFLIFILFVTIMTMPFSIQITRAEEKLGIEQEKNSGGCRRDWIQCVWLDT